MLPECNLVTQKRLLRVTQIPILKYPTYTSYLKSCYYELEEK